MLAGIKHFASSAAVTLVHDDILLFQTQPTLLGGGVVCWGLGQQLPRHAVVQSLVLQVPNVRAQGCGLPVFRVFPVILVFT